MKRLAEILLKFVILFRKIVSSVGPVVTVVYADKNFDDYASGVFSSSDCNSQFPNHASELPKEVI